MVQKVHPEGFRVGYIHDWKSNWFNQREFADYLLEDLGIRDHFNFLQLCSNRRVHACP